MMASPSVDSRTMTLAEDATQRHKAASLAQVATCHGPSPPCLGLRFRQLLEANEHVVLCEANASLGIEWLSPNAQLALGGSQQRGSVLSLVAPESRGFVSRAIFRAARENTTRVCVRANDGRDADLVVVADNEYLRLQRAKDSALASNRTTDDDPRLSRASGSSYAIGLFIFDSRRPPGCRLPAFHAASGSDEAWSKASGEEAAKVGAQISMHGDCLCLFDVDDDGLVVDAMGACDELTLSALELVGTSPLEVVLADDRARVSTAFAQARNAGASSACQIHRCASNYSATTLAISTCAFLPDASNMVTTSSTTCGPEAAGCVVLVYVACHRQSTNSRVSESSSSLASIARELSLKDSDSRGTGSKKRKRTLSTSVLIAPACDGGTKRPSGHSSTEDIPSDQCGSTPLKAFEPHRLFEEERTSADEPHAQADIFAARALAQRLFEEERPSDDEPRHQDDSQGVFALSTSDEAPPVLPAERRRRAHSAPSEDDDNDWGHFVFPEGEPDFNLPPIPSAVITQRSHRAAAYRAAIERERTIMSTAGDKESDLSYEAQPKDDQCNGHVRPTARPPDSTRVVIDLDSVLPRQQSIDNYQRALAAMAPAPAVRYSSLALDNLISNVLPRSESIAAFRASMRELGRRRPSRPAHTRVMSIDFSDEDKRVVDDDDDMWDGDDDDADVDSLVDEKDDVIVDLVNSTTFSSKYGQRRSAPACPNVSPSFSRLCFPLDSAENSFSIDSSPPPISNNTPMDTSALSERPSSTDASEKPRRADLVTARQRQVNIVG